MIQIANKIALIVGYASIISSIVLIVVLNIHSHAKSRRSKAKDFYIGKNYKHLNK